MVMPIASRASQHVQKQKHNVDNFQLFNMLNVLKDFSGVNYVFLPDVIFAISSMLHKFPLSLPVICGNR